MTTEDANLVNFSSNHDNYSILAGMNVKPNFLPGD